MINYTDHLADLMGDIVSRVEALSFIDVSDLLVFARFGRTGADGAYATCHSLNLPTSEPGYYFWRDRATGRMTRRSEWFVTKTPEVVVGSRRLDYLFSFALPRFCDQSLGTSRKRAHYPDTVEPWVAKLDTVVHELYHIDPEAGGIRRFERNDGVGSVRCHPPEFFHDVARFVREYLASGPDREMYDFLTHDFSALNARHGGVVGTTFRNFPSFPQRYSEALAAQPADPGSVHIVPLKAPSQPPRYTERDICDRQFLDTGCRRFPSSGRGRAA
jgi:hypothetical protein